MAKSPEQRDRAAEFWDRRLAQPHIIDDKSLSLLGGAIDELKGKATFTGQNPFPRSERAVISFFHLLQLIGRSYTVGCKGRFAPLLRKPDEHVPKSLIVDQ